MPDDAEHGTAGAVPAQAPGAPFAIAARQIDLAGDAFPNPLPVFGVRHLADKLMARRAGEAVVTALQFEVGGTDSSRKEPDSSKSLGHPRQLLAPHFHAPRFQMNSQHVGLMF